MELSIVIAIIGLLVGGVLAGQNLIRNGEVKSIITDFKMYEEATRAFKETYGQLPGDMNNADDYLDCGAACEGNGNGQVTGNERYRFWQHLALANMISGTYTGANNCTINVTCPGSKIAGAGWSASTYTADASDPAGTYNNTFNFGATAGQLMSGATLTPAEAEGIDAKLDDGRSTMGTVIGRFNNCRDGADYNLDDTNKRCALHFVRSF